MRSLIFIHISISFGHQSDLFFQLNMSLNTQLYLHLKNIIIFREESLLHVVIDIHHDVLRQKYKIHVRF